MKNKMMNIEMALNNNVADALEGLTLNEILASTVKNAEKANRAERFRSSGLVRKDITGKGRHRDRCREQYKVAKNDRLFCRSWDLYHKGIDAYGVTHKGRKYDLIAEEAMKNAVADAEGIDFDEAEYYTAVDNKLYELEQQKKKKIRENLMFLEVLIADANRRTEALKKELEAVEAQLKSDCIKV